MTAVTNPRNRFAEPPVSRLQQLIAGPHQGWLSVLLLAVMLFTVGVAVDDSRWVGDAPLGGSQTAFLPGLLLLAGAMGLVFGKSHVRTARAHLVAGVFGAGLVLVLSANAISSASTLLGRLRELSDSFGLFVSDVFVLGARSTETSAFVLVVGAIAFTTGYFSAYNVFRRNRAMPAVTAIGLVLLINMSITIKVQYIHLIVLAVASMLLLIRLNLVQQEQGWRRRHIAGSEAGALLLRGGALFVAFTLVGSVLLAATASSAPLQSFWRDLDDPLANLAVSINRLVGGVTGTTRQIGGLFGSAETIRGIWESSDEPVFRATTSDNGAYYWRGAAFDRFDGLTWYQDVSSSEDVATNADVLGDNPEQITASSPGRRLVSARVTSLALAGGTMLAPETPIKVDRDTVIRTVGPDATLARIDLAQAVDPGDSYTVTSAVPSTDPKLGVTASMLAAAGTTYPAWVESYTVIEPNSIGQIAYDTANQLVSQLRADQRDPYHIALAMQTFFNDTTNFRYSTDVRGVCGRESIVDCLLVHKVGYCMHYASAMTMLLRTQGIPARLVEGYLPGRLMADNSREVDLSAAHAWVEVYFPGYGWLRFDPTPGNNGNGRTPTALPQGTTVAHPSTSPGAGSSAAPTVRDPAAFPEPNDPNGGKPLTPPPPADTGLVSLLAVTGLLVLAVVLVLIATFRRRRQGARGPDAAYERMTRLAARLGYATNPSQTAYEYAGALGEVLPGIKTELYVVAHAKVELTYARRMPTGSTAEALRNAYRKVRLGLFRLVLRRRTK